MSQLEELQELAGRLRGEVGKALVGQHETVDLLLVALLSQGHVLLEGPPGTAKTLLARAVAASLSLSFGRIQFTPDLMPGDVLGTNLFDFRSNAFRLIKGPVFADIVLADEINRAPPKTQAALLQAMNERAVSIDGITHDLGDDFTVIATQNPIEQQGTYPLPEAQLDRFLFKLEIDYPGEADEIAILSRHAEQGGLALERVERLHAVVSPQQLAAARHAVRGLYLDADIVRYIVALVRQTRTHPALSFGASTRAADALAMASRAFAALDGRAYVLPDDVKRLLRPTLAHRLILSPSAEIEGRRAGDVLDDILAATPAPRAQEENRQAEQDAPPTRAATATPRGWG